MAIARCLHGQDPVQVCLQDTEDSLAKDSRPSTSLYFPILPRRLAQHKISSTSQLTLSNCHGRCLLPLGCCSVMPGGTALRFCFSSLLSFNLPGRLFALRLFLLKVASKKTLSIRDVVSFVLHVFFSTDFFAFFFSFVKPFHLFTLGGEGGRKAFWS